LRLTQHKEAEIPGLSHGNYRVSSPATGRYNCIAFAADDTMRWWWPDAEGDGYWPIGVAREETIEAFVQAFATLGYAPCADQTHTAGFDKVAIYADGKVPTHAAKQLADGRWISKLGDWEDIEHDTLESLEGRPFYGKVALVMQRQAPDKKNRTPI